MSVISLGLPGAVVVGAAPNSPPGFEPNRLPAAGAAGAAPNREVDPVVVDPAEVPDAAEAFVPPKRFGVEAPPAALLVVVGALPNNPPGGFAAGCPNSPGVAADPAAGWAVAGE